MGYPDLEAARRHHSALRLILSRCGGEAADLRALRRVVDLCRDASAAVDDDYCREKIRQICEYAGEMLARGDPGRSDFLRRQIMNALELLLSRLYSLELLRRSAARRISPQYPVLQ